MTIAELNRRLQSIDLAALKTDAFDAVKDDIVIFNREQLAKGENSKGEKIGDKPPYNFPKYFEKHEKHRIKQGLQVEFIDLKWGGKFYESIYAKKEGEDVEIFSDDNLSKVNALMYGGGSEGDSKCGCQSVRDGGFGEEIFGLTDENKGKTRELSIDEIIRIFKQITNL
jgi:hypothetical protein